MCRKATVTPLLFDIDAVGIKKSVGWVAPDDGLLALDRNGNVLADLGSYTRSDGTEGGAGTAAQLADIDLAVDSFHSQFADHIPLTAAASALPDIQGSGQVRSLREAASLDTAEGAALAALLTQYSQATSKSAQLALLDPLLKAWSDTSPMATTFTGAYAGHALTVDMQGVWSPDNVSNPGTPAYQAWAAKLTLMEHFNGRTYQPVPEGSAAVTVTLWHSPRDMLQLSYEALKTSVYQSLALQTRLKPYLDEIGLNITDAGVQLDFTQVKADFTAKIDADPVNGFADLMDFNTGTQEMLANSGWNGANMIVDYLGTHSLTPTQQAALAGNGIFVKGTAGWSSSGTAGDDVMIGDGGSDESWCWGDGEWNAFRVATNDAVIEKRRIG
jgi:hypothetical protein